MRLSVPPQLTRLDWLGEIEIVLVAVAGLGPTPANLSILKNGRARAVRFSTLTALCDSLEGQPGDLFVVEGKP